MEGNRNWTDGDLAALVTALQSTDSHCRYDVPPEELREMIKFVKNWNTVLEAGQRTVWSTVLVLIITGLFALLGLGAYARIKGA